MQNLSLDIIIFTYSVIFTKYLTYAGITVFVYRMYSLTYLIYDISNQTHSSLIDEAGHGDHVEYGDHLGVLGTSGGDVNFCVGAL